MGILEHCLTSIAMQVALNELSSVGLNYTLVHNSFSFNELVSVGLNQRSRTVIESLGTNHAGFLSLVPN
jgi:hypothetical protein